MGDSAAYRARKAHFSRMLTVYGRKPALEVLRDPALQCHALHLADNNREGGIIADLRRQAEQRGVPVRLHSRAELARLSRNGKQDQGWRWMSPVRLFAPWKTFCPPCDGTRDNACWRWTASAIPPTWACWFARQPPVASTPSSGRAVAMRHWARWSSRPAPVPCTARPWSSAPTCRRPCRPVPLPARPSACWRPTAASPCSTTGPAAAAFSCWAMKPRGSARRCGHWRTPHCPFPWPMAWNH